MPSIITYLTAAQKATAPELVEIGKLQAMTVAPYEVRVINGAESAEFSDGNVRATNYVAGTLVAPYNSGFAVMNPDAIPYSPTKVIVSHGQTLAAVGGGSIAVSVVAGVATYTYTAP